MRILLALAVLITNAAGCGLSTTRVGDHDGGGIALDSSIPRCGSDAECTAGNQCFCERCISLDLAPGACDPSCATAQHGDLCTEAGRTCPIDSCSELACTSGSFVTRSTGACDAGGPPDAGFCECPMPPPGCVYDGSPCSCSHMTCAAEHCGREVCGPGTTCCNASCGICAPPGTACIEIACAPDCTPQDAHSDGRCAGSPGWAWDGEACRAIACRCAGSECGEIYPSFEACDAYFSACEGATCGTIAGLVCGPSQYCDYADPHVCGGDDGGGVCRPAPDACPPEIRPSCGCDGTTYSSPCDAYGSGTDVAHDGPCTDCTEDDARGVGACGAVIGSRFTSMGCVTISGCSCAGTDCGAVTGRSEAACNAAHEGCPIFFATPG